MPTLPVRFRCQQPAHPQSSAWNRISVRHLVGLGEMLPVATPIEHRRLPLHGLSPPRSCPRLVLSFLRVTFGILPLDERNRNKVQGTFTPQDHAHRWAYIEIGARLPGTPLTPPQHAGPHWAVRLKGANCSHCSDRENRPSLDRYSLFKACWTPEVLDSLQGPLPL